MKWNGIFVPTEDTKEWMSLAKLWKARPSYDQRNKKDTPNKKTMIFKDYMKGSFLFLTFALLNVFFLKGQSTTDFIHIDQFGYLEDSDKVAVISDPITGYNAADSYTPGASLKLVDELTGVTVLTANVTSWNNGATHTQSGDRGWWFDFSTVTTPGTYYILDEANNTKSYSFEISDEIYNNVAKSAFKMFYYNRCNHDKIQPFADLNYTDGINFTNALQDVNCRYIFDSNNASLERDLTGGWLDAGDYNKYTTFALDVIHDLLYAYQESTAIFTDDWNIPESGNGIPDILDEVNWELQWLEKMMNADGSVINKMGSQNYSENVSSPPSNNTDQRFYGPTCTSASISVASMFSHAALVYENVQSLASYSTTLKNKAITCFDYFTTQADANALEENCDNGEIVAGDADMAIAQQMEVALEAAVHLYELTDSVVYANYIIANINDAPFISGGWLGNNTNSILEALLHYAELPNADASTATTIDNAFRLHVEQDWNDFFGMNEVDLYRSFMPDWSYSWGSSKGKAEYGILNRILRNYEFYPAENVNYEKKDIETLHYFHGVNPQNMVYLTNMYGLGGEKCVNQIYHQWFADGTDYDHALNSLYGPAPGYVTGGANGSYSSTLLSPPYNQPLQKAYADFNHGGTDLVPWEITEPAIYYQASYLRLIAAHMNDACAVVQSLFVDGSNTGASDGGTWNSAFKNLSDVLSNACIDKVDTIFIADGTYVPQTTDRDFVYDLPSGIVLKGGYNSGGSVYNPSLYEVHLSADIGVVNDDSDDLYHGFYFPYANREITLMNLFISQGNANGSGVHGEGSGVYNEGKINMIDVEIE